MIKPLTQNTNFQPAVLIQKKRDGKPLSSEEINFFVTGVTEGTISDVQVGAFLMAVTLKGMNLDETVALTTAMLKSGDHFSHPAEYRTADKHSTGGLGDKVSLILAPLAAACGLVIPSMAGRSLGHTGGTLDKLESIPGFQVFLDKNKIDSILKQNGCSIFGQTEHVCPADRKLYAFRDVTATIECVPLIVASILSKKLAEGVKTLILDVKVGSGAFMKTKSEARILAKTLLKVSKKLGLQSRVLLTDMSQPLGEMVGNSLEVLESIELLQTGRGPSDLKELTLSLCAHMLHVSKVSRSFEDGRKLALRKLEDGLAWQKFRSMVSLQGGDLSYVDDPKKLDISQEILVFTAPKKSYLTSINGERIGRLLIDLGGGRLVPSDKINSGVGFKFLRKLGASVKAGEPVVEVFLPKKAPESLKTRVIQELQASIVFASLRPKPTKLIEEVILS